MSIVNNLPPVPDDTGYSDYIMYNVDGNYKITFFDNLRSVTLNSNGTVNYSNFVVYDLDGDYWDWSGAYIGYHPLDIHRGDIVSSTLNLYNPDGSIYIVGSHGFGNSGLVGGLSSSDFLHSLVDLWAVLPVLIITVVGLVAFRKAWAFFRGLIRGA